MHRILFFTFTLYNVHNQECFSSLKQPQNNTTFGTNHPAGWNSSIEYIRSFSETEEALAMHATKLIEERYKKMGVDRYHI